MRTLNLYILLYCTITIIVGCSYALLKDYGTETFATPFRNFVIGHFNRIINGAERKRQD